MVADPEQALFAIVPAAEAQRQLRFTKRLRVQRYLRIAERCLDLTPAEVAHRLARLVPRRSPPEPRALRMGAALTRAQAITALDRFLVDPRHAATIVADLGRDPRPGTRIVDAARRLVANGVTVFDRTIPIDPRRLDWQADPTTGRRLWADARLDEAAAVAATRIDGRIVTDVKYVWELSRHQFLLPLVLGSQIGGDRAWLALAGTLVDRWIAQNPPGRGVNWSSVLEVGVRAIAWLWTLPFAMQSADLDDATCERWLASLGDHYELLRRNLSIYTDRSNHLIGEATALWLLATVFPEFPDSRTEAARALDVLAVEIERQVTSDGVSCEQALGYHCFVLDFYLQVVGMARRLGTPLPAVIESRVAAMLAFLHRLAGRGGEVPNVGDGDDGLGVPAAAPLRPRERIDAVLEVGARLFARPDWHPTVAPTLHPFAWSMTAVSADERVASDVDARSVLLREGGYCFLEAATPAGGRHQLVLDVGKLGYLPNGAHEHADALSIVVRVNDTLVLGDPGTGTYTASPTIRNGFRGTASHNTIAIDGLDQADVLDTFKWVNMSATEVRAWESDDAFDYVEARHDGYRRLRQPVTHRRAVLFVRPDYWIVVDRIEGRGVHRVSRRFHVPPDVRLAALGPEIYEARSDESGDGVRLTFVEPPRQPPLMTAIETCPWSPGYGRWQTSTRVTSEVRGPTGLAFLTLITPVAARQSLCDVTLVPMGSEAGSNETVLCRVRPRSAEGEDVLIIRRVADEEVFVLVRGSGERRVERRLAATRLSNR